VLVDVGHGSCAVVESSGEICIVDAPQGGFAKRFLEDRYPSRGRLDLKYAIESHGHVDHARGLLNLVTDERINITTFLLNPAHRRTQQGRPTKFEEEMNAALLIGRRQGTSVVTAVTSDSHPSLMLGDLRMSVLWPSGPAAQLGVGGNTEFGRLTLNSLSVVLRVESQSGFSVLLPGDVDAIGLNSLLQEFPNLRADVVVAPHHGGLMGSEEDTSVAWSRIREEVAPSEVLVSLGRNQSANPRTEVIQALANGSGRTPRLRCTQLSKQCADSGGFSSVAAVPSKGDALGECCAGSLQIDLTSGQVAASHLHDERVVRLDQESPVMCRPLLPNV
jgi:beta-lactamase superfamily II metal-dependent hydrolase